MLLDASLVKRRLGAIKDIDDMSVFHGLGQELPLGELPSKLMLKP